MDFDAQRYSPYIRQYFFPLILALFGLMFLGYGMIGYFGQKKDKPDILFEAASDSAELVTGLPPSGNNKQQKQIVVDIEGAVEKPGVYKLASDSRMQDALIAAGGLSSRADREIVAKNLNLAVKLVDGMKVYIPFQGEQFSQSSLSEGGLVNINTASVSELDNLPGIGQATIDKLINNRPYGSIQALVEKKIVGQKVFEQIKEKITAQ